MAVARLLQLEKKSTKDAAFKRTYQHFMEEYIDLKHMELIQENPKEIGVNQSYYTPHHGVFKEDNTTTKLHVVFDASAKTTTGVS